MLTRKSIKSLLIVFCVAGLLPLVGCSSSDDPKPEPEPVELKSSDTSAIDTPEGELFITAKKLYASGLFSVAKESFESIRDGYPNGPFAEFAAIKAADCAFEMRDYPGAAQLYEEFVKERPSAPMADYALLRAGRSWQLSQKGVGRDPAALRKALALYDRLLEQYQDSVYFTTASGYRQEAIQRIRDGEQFIIDFYKKQNKMAAAEARIKLMSQDIDPLYHASDTTPKIKSVRALKKAESNVADAPAMPTLLATRAPSKNQSQQVAADSKPAQPLGPILTTVECNPDSAAFLVIGLSEPFNDQNSIQGLARIRPENGKLVFKVPGYSSVARKVNCLGSEDLELFADGRIALNSFSGLEASVMGLNNPPRLAVLRRD